MCPAGMGVSTCLFNSLCIFRSRVHSWVSTIHGEGWEGGAESEGREGGRRGIECVSCGPLIKKDTRGEKNILYY